jgi:hypothetical protein
MSPPGCVAKSRPSVFVYGIDICALTKKPRNNIFGASSSGLMKSRPFIFVYSINVYILTKEELPNSMI